MDISNTALIGWILGALNTVILALWTYSRNTEAKRHAEREQSNKEVITTKDLQLANMQKNFDDQLRLQRESFDAQLLRDAERSTAQIKYQQTLIDAQKEDLDKLRENNFTLASTIQPALATTNKMMVDVGKFLEKIYINGRSKNND